MVTHEYHPFSEKPTRRWMKTTNSVKTANTKAAAEANPTLGNVPAPNMFQYT
jgi:hypothetical protein